MTIPKIDTNIGNMIPRLLEPVVLATLKSLLKLILVFGPRQAGKTTLLKSLKTKIEKQGQRVLNLNCDLEEERTVINTTSLVQLRQLLGKANVLLLDETQRLDNPGLTLKIIHDNFPEIRVVATGSSSFNLKNAVSDALTGRYLDFALYPLSWLEVTSYQGFSENPALFSQQAVNLLPRTLLYGFYPEIYLASPPASKLLLLSKIVESYLFKDILAFQKVRHSQAIVDLARALAYQIGSEINENELANRLKIDRKTVVNYLDLLEQTFVIIKVHPFSRNPRREIGRNYKIYFLDTGLRNALIGDFHSLEIRSDLGALWENFLIAERIKKVANQGKTLNYYFWRTYGGAEVDWLEQKIDEPWQAFEFKYSKANLSRGTISFTKQYQIPVQLVSTENYLGFI